MPCYDPPPPWEGEAKASAEQATRLLCAMIAPAVHAGEIINAELLLWYLNHRMIDLRIACDVRDGDSSRLPAIVEDIAATNVLLREIDNAQ